MSTKRSSRRSDTSSARAALELSAAQARAEAAVAAARSSFAEKKAAVTLEAAERKAAATVETALEIAQRKAAADVEATRAALVIERIEQDEAFATAQARADVFEEELQQLSGAGSQALSELPEEDANHRVADYLQMIDADVVVPEDEPNLPGMLHPEDVDNQHVADHLQMRNADVVVPDDEPNLPGALHPARDDNQHVADYLQMRNADVVVPDDEPNLPGLLQTTGAPMHSSLDPTALSFKLKDVKASVGLQIRNRSKGQPDAVKVPTPPAVSYNITEEYVRILARQRLPLQEPDVFTGKPLMFLPWKRSFESMVKSGCVDTVEKLSFLGKYTTGEAKVLVDRYRLRNVGNVEKAYSGAWQELEKRFGNQTVISAEIIRQLTTFRKIRASDTKALQELADLCCDTVAHIEVLPHLVLLNTPHGLNPVVDKLPTFILNKWRDRVISFKKKSSSGAFPPFSYFTEFLSDMAYALRDPDIPNRAEDIKVESEKRGEKNYRPYVNIKMTEVKNKNGERKFMCPIHNSAHFLSQCRAFLQKSDGEKRSFLKEHRVCYRCLAATSHMARECKVQVQCDTCGSTKHLAAFHFQTTVPSRRSEPAKKDGGESPAASTTVKSTTAPTPATANQATVPCTDVCGPKSFGRSCSKICLARVYVEGKPEVSIKTYVIIDDQSNRSLAKSELFDMLKIESDPTTYTLKTCSGASKTVGRQARSLVIESLDESITIPVHNVLECEDIPGSRSEIPTPEVAQHFTHLQPIAEHIPPLDPEVDIMLLLGRDAPQAHKAREVRNGPNNSPWAQRLDLGWVVIGEVCLDGAHRDNLVGTLHTHVLSNGRPSTVQPCPNYINVKGRVVDDSELRQVEPGAKVFERREDDERIGMSVEDQKFLRLMDKEFSRNEAGNWVAPLPFRHPRPTLTNNKQQAISRFHSLVRNFERKPRMKDHYFSFMANIFNKGHVEPVVEADDDKECWYLPHFGVYHPQKPEKIRVVFDSSAEYQGSSLNSVLLSGPDMVNGLLGVLMRFREEPVAFMVDVEQMFYSFQVKEEHRDFLRFLWFENNDPEKKMKTYRMKVHTFGNKPSPAVATLGLRKTAEEGESEFGKDARYFVERNFYVDDGLKSHATPTEAIDLLKRTQAMLASAKLRLHKIVSNSQEVMNAFNPEDCADSKQDLDLGTDAPSTQRSLGVHWDMKADTFTFRIAGHDEIFTKRKVLSEINSIYDPIGFAAPVVIAGKMLLRDMTQEKTDWDEPLPKQLLTEWRAWRSSLGALSNVQIHRAYTPFPSKNAVRRELHTFSDASIKAIAAVSYLRTTGEDGHIHVRFILGKAKLAPKAATTIPRLELCGAVLAAEVAELVKEELDLPIDDVCFFTDSKVVLGYISNTTRRFHMYVCNRVNRIHRSTDPKQWRYVPTHLNPADLATRSIKAEDLPKSTWIVGPEILHKTTFPPRNLSAVDSACELADDPEVRPMVTCCKVVTKSQSLGSARFARFSSWTSVVRAVTNLIHVIRCTKPTTEKAGCRGWHVCERNKSLEETRRAEGVIIKCIQREAFGDDIEKLEEGKLVEKDSTIIKLDPMLNQDGIMCVGGRLRRSNLPTTIKHPVLIPGKSHVGTLLVRHFHNKIHHQGRHFTEGATREAGFWITGCKRLVSSVIHHCVLCKKLRGKLSIQRMADLPKERITCEPAFTHIGVDCFGPWEVVARKTRGGVARNKRWAVMFSCLSSRAIHIEVVEEMSTSSFINALRRFISLRGKIKTIRSDQGTNFVGATNEKELQAYFTKNLIEWKMNPPHASHMGGAWERMIGITRRVMDGVFVTHQYKNISHEVLVTVMAEVVAIVNSRPLVPLSSDPDGVVYLTPGMLLTQKHPSIDEVMVENNVQNMYKAQWRLVQIMAEQFWKRWQIQYLNTLQQRRKWNVQKRNVRDGDIVLLRDKNAKRNQWPMAIVDEVFAGADGCVRQVSVRVPTNGKSYCRPIHDLVMLVEADH